MSLILQTVSLLLLPVFVLSTASISSLKSDITLLINNDILANESPNADSAVLLLDPLTLHDAISVCDALGEDLWSPSNSNIQQNLDYITYQGKYAETQQYWIASNVSRSQAINGKGHISFVNKNQVLPGLCTQSAPFSNSTYQDTDTRWQLTLKSNNEYLTGFRDRLSFRFLGIRYAPQPDRFEYSTVYQGSGQNISATEYGSKCVQSKTLGSEDCLFLNIWTPYIPVHPNKPSALKPVMFFIHGGGYSTGTGSDAVYDGGTLVSRGDVVVVAINYRLATFGFLALDDGVTNGNYGFADAITALDWVRTNIRDFGGDPDRITVFGQSSGAATVRAMLASPKAIGKFVAAIPQSNLGGLKDGTYSLYRSISEEVTETATVILDEANCTDTSSQLECLRSLPAYTLASLKTQANTLVVDDTYITTNELVLNGSEPVAKVHILMGTMRDEAGTAIKWPPTTTNFSTFIASQGFDATLVANAGYTLPDTGNVTLDIFNASVLVDTDGEWRCVDQATVYAGVYNNLFQNVYYYEFNKSYAPTTDIALCKAPVEPGVFVNTNLGNPDLEYFKCHGAQMYYIFGTVGWNGLPLRDENDLRFQQFIVDSWSSFARTYDPNPDLAFLKARAFSNTTFELETAGKWEPFSVDLLTQRELQWPSLQIGFRDKSQCAALGYPIDYYLTQ